MHVYVHIPFCDSICFYCDFCRMISNQKNEYISALKKEVEQHPLFHIDTLYFGGGTPSSLSIEQLKEVGNLFTPYLSENYEWTVEANPDSLTFDKCVSLKQMGVNRISLGVQSFNNELLKSIGRKHTREDVLNCIQNIRKAGIENISIDLIFGLPNQSLQDVKLDLQEFLKLDLPHLSIYSLQIEENSVFGKKHIEPCDEDLEADMYECIELTLKENGYQHYEISSFCKESMYSKHNVCYWNDSDFVGLGCGASGREKGIRYDHTRNLKEYIDNPCSVEWIETSKEDRMYETIMMSLRTSFGLDLNTFKEKYKINFIDTYQDVLNKYKPYFKISENNVSVNEKGMEILNTILIDFLA